MTTTCSTRRFRPWYLAAGILITTAGCGFGSSGRPADPSDARSALNSALDSWKGGQKPDDLAARTPPIHVADVDWRKGYRLERYEPAADVRQSGFDLNIAVLLEMKDPRGRLVRKHAIYAVATNPALTVVRLEN